jgi:hypothetical protein
MHANFIFAIGITPGVTHPDGLPSSILGDKIRVLCIQFSLKITWGQIVRKINKFQDMKYHVGPTC